MSILHKCHMITPADQTFMYLDPVCPNAFNLHPVYKTLLNQPQPKHKNCTADLTITTETKTPDLDLWYINK